MNLLNNEQDFFFFYYLIWKSCLKVNLSGKIDLSIVQKRGTKFILYQYIDKIQHKFGVSFTIDFS